MQKGPYIHTQKKEISTFKHPQLKKTSLKKLAQNIDNNTILP